MVTRRGVAWQNSGIQLSVCVPRVPCSGRSDVDIVLFINELPDTGMSLWMPAVLETLRTSLKQASDSGTLPHCEFGQGTPYAVSVPSASGRRCRACCGSPADALSRGTHSYPY